MTIYKLNIWAYNYWKTCDNDGFEHIEKFFTTKEKAEQWIKDHPKYIYKGFNEQQTEAKNDYQMPKFEIKEIMVE